MMSESYTNLYRRVAKFVAESNKIEGINRAPLKREVEAHIEFLALTEPTLIDLEHFVHTITGGARLRDQAGMNVTIGDYTPPRGGEYVRESLVNLLRAAVEVAGGPVAQSPHEVHCCYASLHPFVDGNGRSGRVLWLWMMERDHNRRARALGFLHAFYYQSLEEARA